MRLLPVLLFLVFSLHAQQTEPNNDGGPINVIDGVFFNNFEACNYDSIVRFHTQKTFVITDTALCNYTFTEGKATYLELITRKTKCHCRDCESTQEIIIDLTGMTEDSTLELSERNCTRLYWNPWIGPTINQQCNGRLEIKPDRICVIPDACFDKECRVCLDDFRLEIER